jgi:hypothetical protein
MTDSIAARMVLLILAIFIAGCLFDPRDPENPGDTEEGCWVLPNAPKDVFLNLKCGIESSGNSAYEQSLEPSFFFTPLATDSIELERSLGFNIFADWTRDVEIEVVSNIKSTYPAKRTAQFGDEEGNFEIENIEVGTAWFEGVYILAFDAGGGAKIDTFSGKARFYVIQSTQGWVLRRWEDVDVNGNYSTSGRLRGTMRSSS